MRLDIFLIIAYKAGRYFTMTTIADNPAFVAVAEIIGLYSGIIGTPSYLRKTSQVSPVEYVKHAREYAAGIRVHNKDPRCTALAAAIEAALDVAETTI